jgi:hypothetical protein
MDDEALQKQSDPINLADVVWKIRETVELIEGNSVVVTADQKRKTERFSSIMMMLTYWAMCGGGTVTCDPPESEPDVPEDNPKTLVDQTKDKVKDKGGMKSSRCNGGFPRDDDDCQPSTSVVKRKVVRKKSVVKLDHNVKSKMGDSKENPSSSASCVEVEVVPESPVTMTIGSSSSSSSSSDDDSEGGYDGGKTGLTSS